MWVPSASADLQATGGKFLPAPLLPRKVPSTKPADFAIIVGLPWLMFSVIVFLFTFVYEDFQPLVWALIVTSVLLALLFLILGSASGKPQQLVLGIFALVAVGMALAVGLWVEDRIMIEFRLLDDGAQYWGVSAAASAASFGDASLIEFTPGTSLDIQRSLGMLKLGTAFCIAPIVGPGVGSATAPQFWAVGQDCCGSRGSFECGDVGTAGVHAGAVVADRDGSYAKAMRMLMASQELQQPVSAPIFLRWTSNPSIYKDGLWTRALTINVAASSLYLVSSVGAGVFVKRLLH